MAEQLMIDVQDLKVRFRRGSQTVSAVNGVSLAVARGEVLALIGESGSGKSVTLRALMRLHPERSTAIEGRIHIAGQDVMALGKSQLRALRGPVAAMIFQEPLLAMDPVYTVGEQIIEALRQHRPISYAEARIAALEALRRVRIPSPEQRLDAYPHEMSGGMRQRAMIALALSCQPQLLLADEPTTALDATVQIQILILLRELQQALGLSIVFVTHDIGAAVEVADRVAVMYGGRIVEQAPLDELLHNPLHPYTQVLLSTRPKGGLKKGERLVSIPGSPPDLTRLPAGCAFSPRCPRASELCRSQIPASRQVIAGHQISCHHWNDGVEGPSTVVNLRNHHAR
ncbi:MULTISPECIES: ABC transporter ATP-binding protein [Brenneria]|uniref:ABC-type dipeptide transporter n=1 Tax=Brenneria nigrifluens DSM 30175 = ATCC 13028 TaxID=1121120 RepID=A0A2U1UM45_9GAMM|nr:MULTISPECIES: ABC transporter ATP-binding protein [Brenneria]EHD20638.1 oligopeptide/dipeptide ABC transporter, ATPase subunit [Brenneria sp. EniD312]PWC22691.1 ABC transporter ATP-binding protein [Brenneria nigrifluens DSM 30175 = ATCC 13028]QCR03820.1 ABC transporter ATP-binding protein [Brenneria nigrifluens DSM 30175 = ATCC 13028]